MEEKLMRIHLAQLHTWQTFGLVLVNVVLGVGAYCIWMNQPRNTLRFLWMHWKTELSFQWISGLDAESLLAIMKH